MSETEIRERLMRIETLLDEVVKRLDKDEKHRDDCYKRFADIETYVDTQTGATAATDKMLGKIVSIVTIINIITLITLKIAFHI